MRNTNKGVCVPGFKAGGVKKGKYGAGIILSDKKASCALMLTSNAVKAAPLLVSREHLRKKKIHGIVVNSGNANAYTGSEGMRDAEAMCRMAAKELGLRPENFVVASTGVIGRRLDMGAVGKGIKDAAGNLKSSSKASLEVARAIMTTDKNPKMVSVKLRGNSIELGGIAKGAGMIAPNLRSATMLCFLTTNAHIPQNKIGSMLEEAVEQSFNMTVIDGDTSTNDMVVFLANGTAGNSSADGLQEALNHVTRELAKMIAKDGEGATKFLEVRVRNALTKADARRAAKSIAGSNLVKTAVYGGDPNWGRIIAAAGYSGAKLEPGKISLSIGNGRKSARLVDSGKVLAFGKTKELRDAKRILRSREIYVTFDLNLGSSSAVAYGCDMGYGYIKINAEYTS